MYGVSLGHAGNPSGKDIEKPYETIICFQTILGALLFRVAWRNLRINGDILVWTLRGSINTGECRSPKISNLRRPPSPTSSVGQGRAKRRRLENEAPPQSMEWDGLGGTKSNPIDVDEISSPDPSIKGSIRLSPTLPSLPRGSERFNPPIKSNTVSASNPGISKLSS